MSNPVITAAIGAVLLLGAGPSTATPSTTTEKCYGIAKAGQNDCATGSHGCAGEAKLPGAKNEWLSVPTGLCNKIVGGSTTPDKA